MQDSTLDELLTSGTRAKLLTLFLTHPTEEYYLRELSRRTGQSLRAVQHELPRLERLGLLIVHRRGRQKLYRANEKHPLFSELKRIVYKTAALGETLRQAIETVEGINVAFVYGSVAKGGERLGSDIDLLVIGRPDADLLHEAVRKAEDALGREVSLATMSPEEWRARRASNDAFVADLLKSEKIFLIGDERALRGEHARIQSRDAGIDNEAMDREGRVAQAVMDDILRRIVEVARPERIILFGSAARGTMRDNSDIDLLVIKRGRFHRGRLTEEIYMHLFGVGQAVDVIVVTPDDVERYGDSPALIIERALREGKEVYASAG